MNEIIHDNFSNVGVWSLDTIGGQNSAWKNNLSIWKNNFSTWKPLDSNLENLFFNLETT